MLLSACGKKEQAVPAAPPVAVEPQKPAEPLPTVVEVPAEPKVEFALDCVSKKEDGSRAVFVSLGKHAMFTNFKFGNQRALTLIATEPTSYKFSVDFELTGDSMKKVHGEAITVYRESLSVLYSYETPYGPGGDPFACTKNTDPVMAHEESKKFLISEVSKAADAAQRARVNAEKEKQEQLKRNKI